MTLCFLCVVCFEYGVELLENYGYAFSGKLDHQFPRKLRKTFDTFHNVHVQGLSFGHAINAFHPAKSDGGLKMK